MVNLLPLPYTSDGLITPPLVIVFPFNTHAAGSLELLSKLLGSWLCCFQRTRVIHEQRRRDVTVLYRVDALSSFRIFLFFFFTKFVKISNRIELLDFSFGLHSPELSVQLEELLLDFLHIGSFVVQVV